MNKNAADINHLHVQQLQTFSIVYSNSSYAAASRVIGLSVPTIWEQVRSLESTYGTTLFTKKGRRIVPTEAATRLHESLEPILTGLQSTFELVRQGSLGDQQSITIISGVRMMIEDLAEPFALFRKQFPHVSLKIKQGNDSTATSLVNSGEADLAFTLEPGPEQRSKRMHYEPIYSVDFLAISPPSHPLAQAKRFSLRELSQHELVVGGAGTHVRSTIEEAFHRHGLTIKVAVETDTSAFTIACVRAGMGVGVLAGDAEGELCKDLFARSLQRHLGQRKIMVVWKQGRQLPVVIHELVNLVRSQRTSKLVRPKN